MKTDEDSNQPELIVNRHYNKKELCFLFGNITMYYLNRMIADAQEVGQPLGTSYSPRQILILIDHYGLGGIFMKNQNKISK